MKHLLLLHGAIGSKDQFEPLAAKLADGFIVHSLNFSGHGGEVVPDDFSIKRFADDVIRYLSEQQLTQVDIFGYSMGGYVALFLARHFPESVGRIFTLATKFHWTPEIALRETRMLDANKIAEKIPAFAKQLEHRHSTSDWKMVLLRTAEMMVGLGEENPLNDDDYRSIEHQVLVGIGDKDAMVTLEESIAVYRLLPNAKLIVMPGMQHPLEKADLNRMVREISETFA